MIKYNLVCKCGHTFESWFAASAEFDRLRKKKLITCLFCNSTAVEKTIMAPNLSSSAKKNNKVINNEKIIRNKLIEFRRFVEKNCKYVGENFSKKVREIYYDKRSKKTIYGTATSEERNELEEEGIDLLSIPWVSKDN